MSQERVMLLIDADNLSVDVMEQAIRLLLNQHGGLHVRRAYCTAESAVANQNAFKRLGIKPMVNLAAGKNSTDIAMAVDAIDLVLAERPDVVVIASSDSDFAPLVQRLREKGCVVRGIGQKGKVGDETQDVYDDYTVIEHRGGAAARAPARTAAKPARAPRAGAGRAAKPQQAAGAEAAAARSPAAKAAGSRGRGGSRRSSAVLADDARDAPLADRTAAAVVEQAAVEDLRAPASLALELPAAVLTPETPAEPAEAPVALPAAKRATRARKTAKTAAADAAATATASAETSAAAQQTVEPAAAKAAQPPPEAAAAPAPARSTARKSARKPKVAAELAPPAPPEPQARAVPAEQPTPAAKAPAPAAPAPRQAPPADLAAPSRAAPRATLQAVLDCLPELSRGQSLALNVAVQRLRETRLLGKNSSSLKLFSQLSDSLELLPARNPSQVRLRR